MTAAVRVTGIKELKDALRAMASRIDAATPGAVAAAVELAQEQAQSNLSRYSHARGTPTPSPPGEPPAQISGDLHDNWESTPPVSSGAGTWTCTLRPTMAYAAVQEFGGPSGRGGKTVLRARPFLRPAVDDLIRAGAMSDLFARAWGAAIKA